MNMDPYMRICIYVHTGTHTHTHESSMDNITYIFKNIRKDGLVVKSTGYLLPSEVLCLVVKLQLTTIITPTLKCILPSSSL